MKCYIDRLRECSVKILKLKQKQAKGEIKIATRNLKTIEEVLTEKGETV